MFSNLCSELDRWIKMQKKMQVDGKQKDKKKTCHLALVLETLLRYMFQDNFGYKKENNKNPNKTKKDQRAATTCLDGRKGALKGSP
jgi:hypothetical protein